MALDGPISYNGLTITPGTVTRPAGGGPGSGMRATHFDLSPISVTQYLDKAALRDGMVAGDVYLGERTVSLGVEIYGSTPGDMWDKLQSFAAAFSPTNAYRQDTGGTFGFLPLAFRQPTANTGTWPAGYLNLCLYARPSAPVAYAESLGYDAGGIAAKGLVMPASAHLICLDPRKYNVSEQSLALTGTATTLTHRGDYPTWAKATVTMSGAGSSVFTLRMRHGVGSDYLDVVLDLSASVNGDVYVVDWAKRTVTKNGVLSQGILSSASGWYDVLPQAWGVTQCNFMNNTNVIVANLIWQEAWS